MQNLLADPIELTQPDAISPTQDTITNPTDINNQQKYKNLKPWLWNIIQHNKIPHHSKEIIIALGQALPTCFKHVYEQQDSDFAKQTLDGINILLQVCVATIKGEPKPAQLLITGPQTLDPSETFCMLNMNDLNPDNST